VPKAYRSASITEAVLSPSTLPWFPAILKYRELLQAFATEVSIANDKAANAAERGPASTFTSDDGPTV
jgi:hypothetical protein